MIWIVAWVMLVSWAVGPHVWVDGDEDRIGESWLRGTVVLSWEDGDPPTRTRRMPETSSFMSSLISWTRKMVIAMAFQNWIRIWRTGGQQL